MFRCNFKPSADVMEYELARVVARCLVQCRLAPVVEEEVVAHSTADVGMAHGGVGSNGAIDVEQRGMVAMKVGAYLWRNT